MHITGFAVGKKLKNGLCHAVGNPEPVCGYRTTNLHHTADIAGNVQRRCPGAAARNPSTPSDNDVPCYGFFDGHGDGVFAGHADSAV